MEVTKKEFQAAYSALKTACKIIVDEIEKGNIKETLNNMDVFEYSKKGSLVGYLLMKAEEELKSN